jgi:glycosyltransferase involved in cell wall biosynthesis
MKVLALADACNPEWPSLPVVGYQYAKALAAHIELTVVTQIRNRPNIEKVGMGSAAIAYVDTEKIAAPIYSLGTKLRGGNAKAWTLQVAMDYPSYLAFEHSAYRKFKDHLSSGHFDIVHRITPMSPALPSPIAQWSQTPFVLGPLNGNLPWPKEFMAEQLREREWMRGLRRAYKYLPYSRSTFARSRAILAAFDHTIADLPVDAKPRSINFPEVGINPTLFWRPHRTNRTRLTILYAGRIVPLKLVDVVVQAFAESETLRRHRLIIAGDGPERAAIEELIQKHDLSDCVEVLGNVPQARVAELMRESDIFAFPSIRELGAGVVIEAMACGMACVVADYGGPAALIQDGCGIKVALGNRAQILNGFRTQLEYLVRNPECVERLGAAAHQHAMTHYSWDTKAKKTVEIYNWVLGRSQRKPNFWSNDTPL